MPRLLEKDVPLATARWAVVAARFHSDVTDALLEGALAAFAMRGVPSDAVDVARVPGAFELPLCCQVLAASGHYAAVIALGCVIRGDTSHYDFVAGECCRGVMDAGLATGVPVILGVLTTETLEQAQWRASRTVLRSSAPDGGGTASAKTAPKSNKGWEAAEAALDLAGVLCAVRAEDSR